MEHVASMTEGDWSSFNGSCFTEEADFMAQLLGNCSLPNELPGSSSNYGVSSSFWNGNESNDTNSSMYSGGSGFHFPPPSHESYYASHSRPILMRNDSSTTTEHGLMDTNNPIEADDFFNQDVSNDCMEFDENMPGSVLDGQGLHLVRTGYEQSPEDKMDSASTTEHGLMDTNNPIEADDFFNQDVSNDCMEFDENMPGAVLDGQGLHLGRTGYEQSPEDKMDSASESSKKRSRLHGPAGHVPKNKRSAKLETDLKTDEMDGENTAVLQRQNSMISCCSEDESNVSHELTRKSRASRGSATDSQSLYARKRRERINERLKILQSLIPNGTKVDISTMLEEAVQYVNFLQLQIKLLSSDDLWMYSPIAYNGMDLGLDLRIGIPK